MVTVHICLLKTEKLLTEFSTTPDFSPPGILECVPQESRGPTVSQLPIPLAHLPFLLALHTGDGLHTLTIFSPCLLFCCSAFYHSSGTPFSSGLACTASLQFSFLVSQVLIWTHMGCHIHTAPVPSLLPKARELCQHRLVHEPPHRRL